MANAWVLRPLPIAAASATSTAAGYDPMNVANDYSGVVWKSATGLSFRRITIDLGAGNQAAPDTALLFGCTGATSAWTLLVEGSTDSATTTSIWSSGTIPFLAGETMPTHGRGVGWWESATTTANRRYWRFTIAGLGTDAATVGRIVLGNRLTLERNFGFGAGFGLRDLGAVDFSAQGVMLRRRAAKLRTVGLSFAHVREDEVEAKVQPLIELVGSQEPIALVTDPAADAMRQRRCYFGPLTGDLGTVRRNASAYEWRASLVDLITIPRAG
jgi:hypothetical protein